jgi:small basic protein (TIGR04137 family)
MSIDKSLKIKNRMQRSRNVLTRPERIAQLRDEGRFEEGQSIYGLPKVRVFKMVKRAKAKAEEVEGEGEAVEGEVAAEE